MRDRPGPVLNPYPPPPPWAQEIVTIAVTGTDGKTSTTHFVSAGLRAAGLGPVARMTTVDAGIDDELGPPAHDHAGFLDLMPPCTDVAADERRSR